MAETIQLGCAGECKWHWYNVLKDLVVQGGLKEKDIQNKIIDLMLDDLNVNGYPKEELYNSYKHRADAILKEE